MRKMILVTADRFQRLKELTADQRPNKVDKAQTPRKSVNTSPTSVEDGCQARQVLPQVLGEVGSTDREVLRESQAKSRKGQERRLANSDYLLHSAHTPAGELPETHGEEEEEQRVRVKSKPNHFSKEKHKNKRGLKRPLEGGSLESQREKATRPPPPPGRPIRTNTWLVNWK